MFNYIKDTIVNQAGLAMAKDDKFIVKRAGEYLVKGIQSLIDGEVMPQVVVKTKPVEPKCAVARINCEDLKLEEEIPVALYHCDINIKMQNKFWGEFANPNWAQFGKLSMVEFTVVNPDSAEDIANKLAEALKMAIPYNNKFILVEVDGSEVVLTLADPYMSFAKNEGVKFEKYDQTLCDSCLGDFFPKKVEVTVEDNVEPFATGEWLQENLRFPSYYNLRYAAPNQGLYPVPGVLYTEYSFGYVMPRPGLGGLSGVNQMMAAATPHIFYVAADAVEDFEAALEEAGLEIVEGGYADSENANTGDQDYEEPQEPQEPAEGEDNS